MSKIDEETVILGIDSGLYYGLNSIGSVIWELLNDEIRVSELIEKLVSQYEGDEQEITREALGFLNLLYSKSLIELIHEADKD